MSLWTVAAFTHRGRARSTNEDAIAIDDHVLTGDMAAPFVRSSYGDSLLLMIADGMGGQTHGAVASLSALNHLVAARERLADPQACADAIEEAHQHLFKMMSDPQLVGMGTTLVGAVLTSDRLLTFNVGDSRVYLFTADHLLRLTQDDRVRTNQDHESHALTQSLGGSILPTSINPHLNLDPTLAAGEILILCSDGLTDMVDDRVLRNILSNIQSPREGVRSLVVEAFLAGARDNISVIAVGRSV